MSSQSETTRRLVSGGLAGTVAAAVVTPALTSQDALASTLVASSSGRLGIGTFVVLLAITGAAIAGGVSPGVPGVAPVLAASVVLGVMTWVGGGLTLAPILAGSRLTWSIHEATRQFPLLVGTVLGATLSGVLVFAARSWTRVPSDPVPERSPLQVVVLGGGFGGIAAARRLGKHFPPGSGVKTTIVSESNYLLFTPMLAEVASSALQARHISAPVRAACPDAEFRRAAVERIDTDRRVVELRSRNGDLSKLAYDHLVLALGAVPNFLGVEGMEQHAFTLKTLGDATELRNHVIECLELADTERDRERRRRLVTFVVIGGGFAGTEMIAELFELFHTVAHYYSNLESDEPRFVLVHSRSRILTELSKQLGDYALRTLKRRGIEVVLDARVTCARADAVVLGDGREIPTSTIVWTAGNRPNVLLEKLPSVHSGPGPLSTDDRLRIVGLDRVWAVGDAVSIPSPQGPPYPPTAQHARREGMHVADNIAAVIGGRAPTPFRFETIGILVALGHRTAVAEIRGWRFSGFVAWFMWRTIYLSKLPSLEKRVRVMLDWTIDLLFPRDIVDTARAVRPSNEGSGPAETRGS